MALSCLPSYNEIELITVGTSSELLWLGFLVPRNEAFDVGTAKAVSGRGRPAIPAPPLRSAYVSPIKPKTNPASFQSNPISFPFLAATGLPYA